MQISTKELRKEPGKILKKVTRGQEVVITYRGKKMAKFVNIKDQMDLGKEATVDGTDEIFGLWKDHDNSMSVRETIRKLREARKF